MEKREIEVMWSYYFGMSKVTMIWEEDMEKLHKSKIIKKIYEVIDNEFDEIWYLIRDVKEKSYIIKSKCGNFYAKDIMKKYESEYMFFKISTEIIKIFDKGLYPVVFKLLEKDYGYFYDDKKNINNAFFITIIGSLVMNTKQLENTEIKLNMKSLIEKMTLYIGVQTMIRQN